MTATMRRRPETPLNPEFSVAVPTNGFGEVAATVLASLISSDAPRSNCVTPKVARKVCRIFSPISGERVSPSEQGLASAGYDHTAVRHSARPHTATAAFHRKGPDIERIRRKRGNVDGSQGSDRRPMTSDPFTRSESSRRRQQRPGNFGVRRTSGEAYVGEAQRSRPSTTGATDQRQIIALQDETDVKRSSRKSVKGCTETGSRRRKGEGRYVEQLRGRGSPPLGNAPSFATGPRNVGTPPNRYWPSPGGYKDFLQPFIERNRDRMWAYDPPLVGMDHKQAYRHIVDQGNFEMVKRKLLEKEDALNKGTGSFLMTDTIMRYRGATPRKDAEQSATRGGAHSRRGAFERKNPHSMMSIELDPFRCGGCNEDKLRREGSRRRDLLVHTRTRNIVHCRRKGYEPGDFLKQQPPKHASV